MGTNTKTPLALGLIIFTSISQQYEALAEPNICYDISVTESKLFSDVNYFPQQISNISHTNSFKDIKKYFSSILFDLQEADPVIAQIIDENIEDLI